MAGMIRVRESRPSQAWLEPADGRLPPAAQVSGRDRRRLANYDRRLANTCPSSCSCLSFARVTAGQSTWACCRCTALSRRVRIPLGLQRSALHLRKRQVRGAFVRPSPAPGGLPAAVPVRAEGPQAHSMAASIHAASILSRTSTECPDQVVRPQRHRRAFGAGVAHWVRGHVFRREHGEGRDDSAQPPSRGAGQDAHHAGSHDRQHGQEHKTRRSRPGESRPAAAGTSAGADWVLRSDKRDGNVVYDVPTTQRYGEAGLILTPPGIALGTFSARANL